MKRQSRYLEEKMETANCYCSMQVVFVDIVAYSRRKSHAQVSVIRAFMESIERALSQTARQYVDFMGKIDAHIRRDVIVLPSGDGAAVAFPFDAIPDMHLFFVGELLRTVEEMNVQANCGVFREQGWCDCHGAFLLRSGISEGKLILYRDLNDNFNIAGDTVNTAARVMDLADAGQVFLTAAAYWQIVQMIPQMERRFREYRQARIKHDLRINVYQWIDASMKGLDVSRRGGLGLADATVEPDDEVTPLGPDRAGRERTDSENRDEKSRDSSGGEHAKPSGSRIVSTMEARMVSIPAGRALIGNTQSGRVLIEVQEPLLVDRFLVTQDVYKEVMGHNPSRFVGDQLPVERVSWLDAIAFCNRLSELSGLQPVYQIVGRDATAEFEQKGYRLPTEAEWEYCCRAGGGEEERYGQIDLIAWYNSNSGGQPHEAGKKTPNAFGLYDMLGNLWEWCNDWYQRRYPEEPEIGYRGPESGFERVLRGGAWSDLPGCIRASFRHRSSPLARDSVHGFRIVRGSPRMDEN